MLREIGEYLSSQGFAIISMTMLWLILSDEKALERIRKKKVRRLFYISIVGYFFVLAVEIVRIALK